MVFMDEYEMPSIFLHVERRNGNSPHSRPRRIRGERKKSISTFVLLSSMRYYSRMVRHLSRDVISRKGCIASIRAFFHDYTGLRRDFTRSILERGIIATLVISNLSSFRTCYSLILRGGTRVLFHEKFQRVRIANRVYKISLSRNSCSTIKHFDTSIIKSFPHALHAYPFYSPHFAICYVYTFRSSTLHLSLLIHPWARADISHQNLLYRQLPVVLRFIAHFSAFD